MPRRGLVLLVTLVAAFAINLDTTIVNVALPSLAADLGAGTRGLQWVVDGYNLAFATLVLAGGAVGDRYGRRGTLVAGLAVFALASAVAPLAGNTAELVAARVVMGVAAACIFPTTLSIISQVFPDRGERAKAIGAWGAVAGIGVAAGPILGGALLEHYSWGSIFLALVPAAVLALAGALLIIPPGRQLDAPRLDLVGTGLSIATLGLLVGSIIEAPDRGWSSPLILTGFALAAGFGAALVVVEQRVEHPMLDVRLFTNLRFTAASGAVTVAFFALFGFIFLITQYMQVYRGYSPLSTGLRILPVALSIAVTSAGGTMLAVRIGNKAVVATGLLLLVAAYGWISLAPGGLRYEVIAAQMVLMGSGLGLTSAPATESIMGVVRPEKAGIGSALNDATREIGGTLGVAVIGSVFASLYRSALHGAIAVPDGLRSVAERSYQAGAAAAGQLGAGPASPGVAGAVRRQVDDAFLQGLHAGCAVASGVCLLGALAVLRYLPARPLERSAVVEPLFESAAT